LFACAAVLEAHNAAQRCQHGNDDGRGITLSAYRYAATLKHDAPLIKAAVHARLLLTTGSKI
jgi:hypothetical protein